MDGLETAAPTKRQEDELEAAELKMLSFSLRMTTMDMMRAEEPVGDDLILRVSAQRSTPDTFIYHGTTIGTDISWTQ